MKKYFILAAAALVTLASCMKNNVETSGPKEISYNAVAAKNTVTKAINEKTYYAPTDPSFGIWGLYQENGAFATDKGDGTWVGTDADSATEITYNSSAWRNASNTDYWPLTGSLVFMGYSPFTDDGDNSIAAEISVVPATPAVKITFSDFSSEDGEFTTDLMWSDAVEKTAATATTNYDADGNNTTTYNGVPVVFHHALSQIVVNAKTDKSYGTGESGYVFTITGLTLYIDDVATLEVTHDLSTGSENWAEPETDADVNILKAGLAPLTTSLAQQSNAVVVIPQTLGTKYGTYDDKLHIAYQVDHNGVTSSKEQDILLTAGSTVTLSSLAANTIYNLNLTFSLTEIKYSPDVIDWTSANSAFSVSN